MTLQESLIFYALLGNKQLLNRRFLMRVKGVDWAKAKDPYKARCS